MGAPSAPAFDETSTGWDASPQPERPLPNVDPNPLAWARRIPSSALRHLGVSGHDQQPNAISATWTSSSGDLANISDADGVEVRDEFVQEYNRLARKHGIPAFALEECSPSLPGQPLRQQTRSWFSRTFLRQVSTASDASSTKSEKKVRNKRSVGDLALHLVNGARRDSLKHEDLQSLVRLCGKSKLYLPSEYSPGSLVLPTCFRATAQYLVQHGAETRGIFRIPGSVRIINALYNYYCADIGVDEISSTISCPNLPSHIKAGTHDVASTFKRLLSGLPGGILGSLSLFDTLVAIQSQLNGEAEFLKTKQTKLRARLIALAVGTVKSQLRRDLICAVVGLLCLIGRAAEMAPREDEHGRPLPTSGLMGYNALGIIFGPLLIGDLLNAYTATAAPGQAFFPVTPPNMRNERRRSRVSGDAHPSTLAVDKIYVANSIMEMLITHWREVVRHMRSLGVLGPGRTGSERRTGLPPSASEAFMSRIPRPPSGPPDFSASPVPPSPASESARNPHEGPRSSLLLPRRRPRGIRPLSSSLAGLKASLLSPPVEEPSTTEAEESRAFVDAEHLQRHHYRTDCYVSATKEPHSVLQRESSSVGAPQQNWLEPSDDMSIPVFKSKRRFPLTTEEKGPSLNKSAIEAKSLSTPATLTRWRHAGRQLRTASKGTTPFKGRPYRDNMTLGSTPRSQSQAQSRQASIERLSQDVSGSGMREPFEEKAHHDNGYRIDVFGRGRSRLSAWRLGRRSLVSTDSGSPVFRRPSSEETQGETAELESSRELLLRHGNTKSTSPLADKRRDYLIKGSSDVLENRIGQGKARRRLPAEHDDQLFDKGSPLNSDIGRSRQASVYTEQPLPLQALSGNITAQGSERTEALGVQDVVEKKELTNKDKKTARALPLGPRPNPAHLTLGTVPRSRPIESTGSAVRAMAAMFESTSSDKTHHPSPVETHASRHDIKPSGMLSPYTVNPSPTILPSKSPKPRDSISSGHHKRSSLIRGRHPQGSRAGVRREVAKENSGASSGQGRVWETARRMGTRAWYSAGSPPTGEHTARVRSPEQSNTPKQPHTPVSVSWSPENGSPRSTLTTDTPPPATHDTLRSAQHTPRAATPTTPADEPHYLQTTPTPGPRQNHGHSNSPHPPKDEASPASTTRRRLPPRPTTTPEQQRQQEQATPHTPTQTQTHTNGPRQVTTTTTSPPSGITDTPSRSQYERDQPAEQPAGSGRKHGGTSPRGADVIGRLREELGRARQECALWRERAERAEARLVWIRERVAAEGGCGSF